MVRIRYDESQYKEGCPKIAIVLFLFSTVHAHRHSTRQAIKKKKGDWFMLPISLYGLTYSLTISSAKLSGESGIEAPGPTACVYVQAQTPQWGEKNRSILQHVRIPLHVGLVTAVTSFCYPCLVVSPSVCTLT